MTKEILERALSRTNKMEESEKKRVRAAETIGKIVGVSAALALDAVVVWAILNFMISFSVGYLPVLGFIILAQLTVAKIKTLTS